MAAVARKGVTLTSAGRPERIWAARATPSLFRVLGVRPLLGRTFAPDEDQAGRDAVAVVSHAFWARQRASRTDPSIALRGD